MKYVQVDEVENQSFFYTDVVIYSKILILLGYC